MRTPADMSEYSDIEHQLEQAFAGSGHLFLIDEPSIVDSISSIASLYKNASDSIRSKLFIDINESDLSESALLNILHSALPADRGRVSNENKNHSSIIEFMSANPEGLISIQAGHTFSESTVNVFANLLDHARKNQLNWKLFIVADTLLLDEQLIRRLGAAQSIPDTTKLENVSVNSISKSSKRRSRVRKKRVKSIFPRQLQSNFRGALSTNLAKVLFALLSLTMLLAIYLKGVS